MIVEDACKDSTELALMEHNESFSDSSSTVSESIEIDNENESVDSFKSVDQEFPMDFNSSNAESSFKLEKINKTKFELNRRTKSRTTISKRAGLILPVKRIHNRIKSMMPGQRIRIESSIKLTAALEYLIAELIDISGLQTFEVNKLVILPRHIFLATQRDAEFNTVCKHITFPDAGVNEMFKK